MIGLMTSCNTDMGFDREDAIISAPDASMFQGSLQGDDYVWTWSAPAGTQTQVTLYSNGAKNGSVVVSGNTYTHKNIDTNIPFTYVFKFTDGTNYSEGAVCEYTRPGASMCSGLSMAQLDKVGGYDALVTWNANATASNYKFKASNGGARLIEETLPASTTSYTIEDVTQGETWSVTITAVNAEGSSLPASTSLRIGKTAIGFLSIYSQEEIEDLSNDAIDDDEASAWLWLHETYPTAQFVKFGDIKSIADIDAFRVLFWIRDIDGGTENDVFTMPADVAAATPVIKQWYADGGNLLLWSHAIAFIENLGRIPEGTIRSNDRAIGVGAGGWNGDTWKMAVNNRVGNGNNYSTHPLYRGLDKQIETTADGLKLLPVKGPGYTMDHNMLFFNYPSQLTGLGNQDENIYNILGSVYGIYPLGTWDSQANYISQLNVWEAQQGNTDLKGTILCIGNGGCEFSMRNEDGSADKSAHPKNNTCQDNILTMAKNALEYLKTR